MLSISVRLLFIVTLSHAVYVSNLDVACLKCICTASTGCLDNNYGCNSDRYCGPFFINRQYWEEADRVTLNNDPRYPEEGHEDCAKNFQCASRIVSNYMAKHGRDCNRDGITDCEDFARIHYLSPSRCGDDNRIVKTSYYDRFISCVPPKPADDASLLRRK